MRSLWLVLALFGWTQANAQNVSRLYPRAKLEADAARFGGQIQAEYNETILPQLTEAERGALDAIKIEVPAAGRKGDPFEFYTDGRTVYLPAFSLRFFADLCLAHAWLNAHGNDGTTVRDYVGLLFREATLSPTAPLHPIFATLGVPENAREETAVSNRADRNFGNTVVFLLAHELGHVLRKHRPDVNEPALQRKQEIEADQFAIEVMRRIGQVPLGLEFWFDLERIRHQAPKNIPAEADWQKYLSGLDHPVTTERLEALATAIEQAPDSFARNQSNQVLWAARAKTFAQYFRLAAPLAGNAGARVAEYSRVRDLRIATLKPRKAAFAAPLGDGTDQDFQGLFRIRRTFTGGKPGDEFDLLLLRHGDDVLGHYSGAQVEGSVEGKISEGVLRCAWKEGTSEGHVTVESVGDTLSATWGSGAQDKGTGTWKGARVRRK
ncbi:MAG TPA: hypothetical protein VK474_10710 [Chthoniobacterales bacterium]|nr:hypothetical protein [Chthoniobacterales bacterium]